MRVPDVARLEAPAAPLTLAAAAERWRTSRVDVAKGTAATHKVNLRRILSRLGTRPVDELEPADVAQLVAELTAEGLARESIRKTRATLAMVLDFHGLQPNVARDRSVKLPREDRPEVNPPTAAHVAAVAGCSAAPTGFRCSCAEASGMRIGELESLVWGDVDEQEVAGASRRRKRRRSRRGGCRSSKSSSRPSWTWCRGKIATWPARCSPASAPTGSGRR